MQVITYRTLDPPLLPPGIILNPNGTFSGFATRAGVYVLFFTADSVDGSATTTLRLDIKEQDKVQFTADSVNTNQRISINTTPSPVQAISSMMQVITYAVDPSTLPPGIVFNPNGTFSGLATTEGTYVVTITAIDSMSEVATTNLVINVVGTEVKKILPPTQLKGRLRVD